MPSRQPSDSTSGSWQDPDLVSLPARGAVAWHGHHGQRRRRLGRPGRRHGEFLSAQGYVVVGVNVRQYLSSFTAGKTHLAVTEPPEDYRALADLLAARISRAVSSEYQSSAPATGAQNHDLLYAH